MQQKPRHAAGNRAMLPHVDRLAPAHNVAGIRALVQAIRVGVRIDT
jgi:uncharacterized protein with von Willebrand factor type A (vWA) domain